MSLQVSLGFLIIACLWAISPVSGANRNPSDCCLMTRDKEIPFKNVQCYFRQDLSTGCNIDAVVFRTRRNKNLCAPPNALWVKELIKRVDKHRKKCVR
ncbi:C-C motif chemokine 21-like [Mixophyes fleayi]|uniref:C-C motif chemokine 21-like n=1 Tax=Mixophyes fleayi TaxID=3061075 RepID=UPI003F4E06D0